MYNYYIASLQGLRRAIDNRIDSEIEEAMRKRGDSEKLKDSLRYIIAYMWCFVKFQVCLISL